MSEVKGRFWTEFGIGRHEYQFLGVGKRSNAAKSVIPKTRKCEYLGTQKPQLSTESCKGSRSFLIGCDLLKDSS